MINQFWKSFSNQIFKFSKAPFAWISAKEVEGGRTRVSLEKPSARNFASNTRKNRSERNFASTKKKNWSKRNFASNLRKKKDTRVGRQNPMSNGNKPLLK